MDQRFVFDTNTVVSRMLLPDSVPASALSLALRIGTLLTSKAALEELADVLGRSKFDRYVSLDDRKEFFRLYCRLTEQIETVREIAVCRDPKDNRYLEIAANGKAQFIVTGDQDLLILHQFEKCNIITPAAFIEIQDQAATDDI